VDELDVLRRFGSDARIPPDHLAAMRTHVVAAFVSAVEPSQRGSTLSIGRGRLRVVAVAVASAVTMLILFATFVLPAATKSHGAVGAVGIPSVPQSRLTHGIVPGPFNPTSSLFDPDTLLLHGGQQVTLEEAESLAGHPVYRPDTTLQPQVWVAQLTDEDGNPRFDVGLRYDSSLVILYSPWPQGADVAARYAQEASQWRQGYVTAISGNPAWVIPAQDNQQDESVSVVHVTFGSWEVELMGRMAIGDLQALAQSLHS
jgi:hypothetical protein